MKRIIIVITGLVAVLFGVGGSLPALAQMRDSGVIPGAFIGSYTLGVVLVSVVVSTTVSYAITKRKAEISAGFASKQLVLFCSLSELRRGGYSFLSEEVNRQTTFARVRRAPVGGRGCRPGAPER